MRRRAALLLATALLFLTAANVALLAQNMGDSPQTNVAVQGQTGAQPEGAFLNLVNWVGNVIAPVGAALAIAAGLVSFISGRGVVRYVVTALGCLAVSGVTRLLEFWINQGGGGVS
jgi:hypothetical protein